VFRTGEADDVLLQSPHGYHDEHTAEIGWAAFRRSSARGFFFNTAHRYRAIPGERQHNEEFHRADLVHTTDSYFYVATDAFLRQYDGGVVLQLHGFADSRLSRHGIDIVVSDGTDEPGPITRRYSTRLKDVFGEERVALYPDESDKLGATANTIGRLTRLTQRGHFVHLEMSPELRSALLEDIDPLVRILP
jgi:hypothetical protein